MYNNINVQLVATANLSGDSFRHHIVDIDGTLAQAGSQIAAGPLQTPTKTGSGEHITACILGNTYCKSGGAISKGAKFILANSGFVTAASSADASNSLTVGKALVAANSGDIFEAFVNFANN